MKEIERRWLINKTLAYNFVDIDNDEYYLVEQHYLFPNLRIRYALLNTGISIDFDRFPTLGLDLKNSP